jgi:hypothetical protein
MVSGQVLLADSGRPVPGLLIDVEHVDGRSAVRLASAVVGPSGTFVAELPSPPAAARGSAAGRWNLRVTILAPERSGRTRAKRVVYTSETRVGASDREVFRLELSASDFKRAGVAAPLAPSRGAPAIADPVRAGLVRGEAIATAVEAGVRDRLTAVDARRQVLRGSVRTAMLADLSTVTPAEVASGRYVPPDADIEPAAHQALRVDLAPLTATRKSQSLKTDVGRIQRPGRLLLTDAQRKKVVGTSGGRVVLTERQLADKLGAPLTKPAVVYRLHLEPDPCRPKTDAERCLDGDANPQPTSGGSPATPAPTGPAGSVAGAGVQFDGDAAIANLFSRQTRPEDPVEFGVDEGRLEGRLTADEVSRAIGGLTFAPGPADVPAFYDFHDIQLAFEPVWQEALDDRFVRDVEDAYDRIVELGGAPATVHVNGFLTAPPLRRGLFIDGLLDVISDIGVAVEASVPAAVVEAVYISLEEWQALPDGSRNSLVLIANRIQSLREQVLALLDPAQLPAASQIFPTLGEQIRAANTAATIALRTQIQLLTDDADRIVAHARRLLVEREAKTPFTATTDVIDRLRQARSGTYPFRYFAATSTERSVNFGLMVTYRQKWTPVSYQVGELVSTIPLAPREIRRFSKRTVVRTKRARQEVESNLSSRRGESEDHSRAESEIVSRATAKTNFGLTNEGTMNVGDDGLGGSAKSTTTFTRDVENHSDSVKKEFREAILKSAEEYKNERKVEVTTEETTETEVTESGEIQNPNDEIPVTFMFYELQRRFRVSEKIHRVQSVVFVAQEMPSPGSIDEAWLIKYDWILNRVLLDDSHRPALMYVSTTLVSEEVVLNEQRGALFRQRELVEELKEDVADRRALTGLRYAALQRQIERTAQSTEGGSGGGLFGAIVDVADTVTGGLAGDLLQGGMDLLTGGGPSEGAQLREGAARDAYDREQREQTDLANRLANAISTLESMQTAYSERLGAHLRERTQVERLITHIVQNILYYMQAIWAHEVDDQRFLRLRNVPVPVFETSPLTKRYVIDATTLTAPGMVTPRFKGLGYLVDFGHVTLPPTPQPIPTRPLSEVADLNRPFGFLGNYLMFPMIEANPITNFMMDPYVVLAEGEYGLSDPDPLGNMNLDEFADYICCLRKYFDDQVAAQTAAGKPPATDPFDELKPDLEAALRQLLQLSLRNDDEIVVPTNSLFVEALPGAHSILEQFKSLHRQIDVKAAQETLRATAIDNVRRAERIIAGDLEDPSIEAKYVFEGGGSATVIAPTPPGGGGPGGGG